MQEKPPNQIKWKKFTKKYNVEKDEQLSSYIKRVWKLTTLLILITLFLFVLLAFFLLDCAALHFLHSWLEKPLCGWIE